MPALNYAHIFDGSLVMSSWYCSNVRLCGLSTTWTLIGLAACLWHWSMLINSGISHNGYSMPIVTFLFPLSFPFWCDRSLRIINKVLTHHVFVKIMCWFLNNIYLVLYICLATRCGASPLTCSIKPHLIHMYSLCHKLNFINYEYMLLIYIYACF